MLTLQLQRISPTHHRLIYIRPDGSRESADIETKTFLSHDFIHFALESEGHLIGGFFGLLAQGYTYAQLAGKEVSDLPVGQAKTIEQVVGPLSGVIKGEITPAHFLEGAKNLFDAHGEPIPRWLTLELVSKTKDRYKRLMGQWNSLSFGEVLELSFDPNPELADHFYGDVSV